jgi:hypothetical protein
MVARLPSNAELEDRILAPSWTRSIAKLTRTKAALQLLDPWVNAEDVAHRVAYMHRALTATALQIKRQTISVLQPLWNAAQKEVELDKEGVFVKA